MFLKKVNCYLYECYFYFVRYCIKLPRRREAEAPGRRARHAPDGAMEPRGSGLNHGDRRGGLGVKKRGRGRSLCYTRRPEATVRLSGWGAGISADGRGDDYGARPAGAEGASTQSPRSGPGRRPLTAAIPVNLSAIKAYPESNNKTFIGITGDGS